MHFVVPLQFRFGIGFLADNMFLFLELNCIYWIWFCSLNYVIYVELYECDLDIFSYIFMYFKYLLIYLFKLSTKIAPFIFLFFFKEK